ncbi:MAG: hypothetical protein WCK67_13165 [bacterium]
MSKIPQNLTNLANTAIIQVKKIKPAEIKIPEINIPDHVQDCFWASMSETGTEHNLITNGLIIKFVARAAAKIKDGVDVAKIKGIKEAVNTVLANTAKEDKANLLNYLNTLLKRK